LKPKTFILVQQFLPCLFWVTLFLFSSAQVDISKVFPSLALFKDQISLSAILYFIGRHYGGRNAPRIVDINGNTEFMAAICGGLEFPG
jgi:hypothetical protein